MASEKFNPAPNRENDKERLSRRQFLTGLAAVGATAAVGAMTESDAEAAPNSKAPSVDELANMVKQTRNEDELMKRIFGTDPKSDADKTADDIDKIMQSRPGARSLGSEGRLQILTKVDNLKAQARRSMADFRLYADEARGFGLGTNDARMKQSIQEKLQPSVAELFRVRDELSAMRDDVNRRFPQ